MAAVKNTVLIFNPTPNEYKAVSESLKGASFNNFTAQVIESGPGKINAAFQVGSWGIKLANRGEKIICLVGAGTSGSLTTALKAGDVIASATTIISDWKMDDDHGRRYALYGKFCYNDLTKSVVDEMTCDCPHPTVAKLLMVLNKNGFALGKMLTSDTFVAGRENKLAHGRDFEAVACDMESGAFAYGASLLGLSWFNLRVVADTLDDTLDDYFDIEVDMANILGAKTLLALRSLDEILSTQTNTLA
ncbi:MAG: hypothetical protein ACRCTY_07380 [Candidatus Adiutrix sp.]